MRNKERLTDLILIGNNERMSTIVLISCGSKKSLYKTKAENMYKSSLFLKSLKYAQIKLKPDFIYILSAKHGLLDLDKEIEPYNVTLKKKTKEEKLEWSNNVIQQLKSKQHDIEADKFIFLAGQDYYKDLIQNLPNNTIKMEKLSLFKRLPWLNRELNE